MSKVFATEPLSLHFEKMYEAALARTSSDQVRDDRPAEIVAKKLADIGRRCRTPGLDSNFNPYRREVASAVNRFCINKFGLTSHMNGFEEQVSLVVTADLQRRNNVKTSI